MAQVYSFVDENGQTRLLAEIHPDPAGTPFNGGMITGALVVNKALAPSTTDKVLDILDSNNPDAEVVVTRSVDGAGNEDITVGISAALNGTTSLALADDNFVGSTTLYSNGIAILRPRAGASASQHSLSIGNAGTEAGVIAGGYLFGQAHVAPADAALAAGDYALWFDQTNAAAKLMVKAKTADGTVVAASINLA